MQGDMFEKKSVLMEWSDGSTKEVSLDPPQSPRAEAFANRDKSLYYWSKSGLHKSLRRRDYGRAVRWAQLLDRCKPGEARRYMRSILFEETRNFRLLGKFADPYVTVKCLIRMFCSSPMDWELEGDMGVFSPEFYRLAAIADYDPDGDMTEDHGYEYPDIGMCQATMEHAVATQLWSPASNKWGRKLRKQLVEEAKNIVPHSWLAGAGNMSGRVEEILALAQLSRGPARWAVEACEFSHDVCLDIPDFEFPWLDWGVLDYHTREGRKNHRVHGHTSEWGKPNHPRIDLRWGGAWASTLWRYLAFNQFGTVHVPFEDVGLPDVVRADFKKINTPMV